jgi:tripartite-type tricarboxylate transporter receptor subunit TctC
MKTVISAALAVLLTGSSAAQDYPTRTIRVITNVSAGGTYDIFIRALASELHKRGGKPVIVEPRPGGNFLIGGRACAEAPADGYSICALSQESLYADLLNHTVPYDPRRDFVPITNLFFNTQALVVNSALGVKTLEQLAVLAKARPKTLAYLAPALPQRLFIERFNRDYGTDLVNVPFRGGGEAVNSILSGTTSVAFFGAANFLPYVQEGRLVALAVDGERRSPLYPNVPSLAELGFREKLPRNYLGLVAPAATPQSIVEWLHQGIVEIINDPAFRQPHLVERGLEPIADSPSHFAAALKADRAEYDRFLREAGFQPQ